LTSRPVGQPVGVRRERLDAAIYFAGTLFQRLSLFLALPLLLRSLSAAEFGTFGLLQSAVNLLPAILTLNLPATATRLFFDGATEAERQTIATRLTVLSGALGLLASAVVWLCANAYRSETARVLGVPEGQVMLATTLVLVGALGSNHLQVAWGLWRAQNRALHTAIAISLAGLLFLAGVAALSATHRLGAVTAIGAYACATALVGITANGLVLQRGPRRGGSSYAALGRDALRYGLPVLPYLFAVWGLGAGGRWIARATLTLEDTGNFTLASQLAIMIGLVGRSAYDAWAPRSFEMFADGRLVDAREYLRARARLTLAVVGTLAVVTAAGFALFVPRFAPSYHRVASLIPIVALAPLFDVAHMSYHTELMGLKVTRPIATYTLTTLLLFVVLGVAGAHLLGLWGLTVAYVLGYAAQWLLAARAVRLERRSSGLSRARADAPNDMDNPLWP
jgi:O-antigen/teichoic acid export membrane protein